MARHPWNGLRRVSSVPMADHVTYELADGIATIAMDDGKVNVLSVAMLQAVADALTRAASDGAVVVLTGRPGRFSGGFDLGAMNNPDEALGMVRGGFELAERLLMYPRPVVVACTGHAIAMAAFLLLTGDYRVGADGDFRITANEVAIGLTLPYAAIELCRYRLTRRDTVKALVTAHVYSPSDAVGAAFLDEVVPPDRLAERAREIAAGLTVLNAGAHTATKQRVHEPVLNALRAAIDSEFPPGRTLD